MGSHKKIAWTDADVRCPFYIAHERTNRSICCEGYENGVETLSRFGSLELRDRHMGLYCTGRFEHCPVYGCIYGNKYCDE